MAVISDLTKVTVTMKLNNGISEDGKVKTVNNSLASMNVDRYDDQKAMNIVELMRDCVAKEIYETIKITQSTLSESD